MTNWIQLVLYIGVQLGERRQQRVESAPNATAAFAVRATLEHAKGTPQEVCNQARPPLNLDVSY